MRQKISYKTITGNLQGIAVNILYFETIQKRMMGALNAVKLHRQSL